MQLFWSGALQPRHERPSLHPIAPIAAITVALLLASSAAVGADPERQVPAGALKTLSVEELMDIDVSSVSRRTESMADTAAAVDVLTGEDLRRSGATTLPEALRLASGLFVARSDGHTWAISARGFTAPTSTKLLVLIDGRTVYTPLFSGVFWDVQDVPLADVERIEVVRGPGATLWGANAVNGVINVITKPAARTAGGQVDAGAGRPNRLLGTTRYGDRIGDLSYRVYAKYDYLDENVRASGAAAHDALRRGSAGGRADWAISPKTDLSLIGAGYRAAIGLFDRPDADAYGWNLLGRLHHVRPSGADLQVQAYYDRTTRRIPWQFEETRGTWDLDVQYRARPTPRHALLAGGGYRLTRDTTGVPDTDLAPPLSLFLRFDPPRRDSPLPSAYLQDEFEAVAGRLFLTAGVRLEHNDYTGLEVQPTLRARWRLQPRGTAWAAVSRAVRTPSRLDADVRVTSPGGLVVVRGNPDFLAETVVAYEAGYRVQATSALSVDLAAYHNQYDLLRSAEPGAPGAPATIGNGFRGHTTGLETTIGFRPAAWMRWRASWTLFDKQVGLRPGSGDPTLGAAEGNDPGQTFGLRATVNLPREVELDGFLRAIASLPAPRVPAYAELDLRAGWWITPDWEVSFVGQNLLHDRHPEFGPPTPGRTELERGAYIRLTTFF